MRLGRSAGRCIVLFLSLALVSGTLGSSSVLADSPEQASATVIQAIIDKAEESYRQGVDARAKGDVGLARWMFDKAVDDVLMSGINLRANAKLDQFYRDLLDRIHKHEAPPDDIHAQRPEVVEPAVLDQLSQIQESELATVTPDGMKVYGKFDFDFSVALPVFQYISYFTSGRGRSTMEAGLQRSGRYRQMAEKIFKEERVPLDLIWLAQAESVWKPKALSRAAAKGIWQFIPSTGIQYGLSQSAWVDDRSHPEKSTRAAARYLRFLHEHFAGDWLLAMAAYNSGENRVDSTIARCGYADFWEIHRRGLLPQETRNYVPIILAIMIVSKNQKRYGFDTKPDPPLNYDTYELPGQTDLKVVADLLGAPYETIEEMNPDLRRGVSPPGRPYTIRLPKGMRKQFEVAYSALPEDQRVRRVVIPREEIAQVSRRSYRTQQASYTIRNGDTLSSLARRHGVSVEEVARLNGISTRGQLRKGQKVRIPASVRSSKKAKGHKVSSKYGTKRVVRSTVSSRNKASKRTAKASQAKTAPKKSSRSRR
jgi:membrane-bound lytic murein transglycosylase D